MSSSATLIVRKLPGGHAHRVPNQPFVYGLPDSEILVARDSFTPMAAAARVLLVNSTGSGYYYAPGLKAKSWI
jgi:hypothetical protein